jgi:pyruvate formate lyase activating enzyme
MTTGIITNIQPYCTHDGPGIRTTVFLKGCQLNCAWCCNPETQGAAEVGHGKPFKKQSCFWGCEYDAQEIVKLCVKDRTFYDTSGGGVTLSGGDPLYQPDFTLEILDSLKREYLKNMVVIQEQLG